ncbi:DUF427 domain-containing protein [Jiangella alkaliphila]|uniref:Uncharacterized conserved protein, DUF427 family n=1 Tax=Jiangella alkaliphila TaxID=419479 RepID=A0A1H2M3W3_9ACTN|nr:DUF427 domain-containing protein [Jiangella alkaliphila]SDU87947.1 Uncharacterized conserved protein, DUF427 family [Jiangella alkaliphila]
MGIRMSSLVMGVLPELRYEPTPKRIRAVVGGETWADTASAMVVWEPRRIVPGYAVPETDLDAELLPAGPAPQAEAHAVAVNADIGGVLDPRTPFSVRSTEGEPVSLRRGSVLLDGAGFRPADPDLAGYVCLDWSAFDQWLEEDDEVFAHARDPFKRIDVRSSSRHVTVSVDGVVLADSTRAKLLFETHLPTRSYVPREDVRMDLLVPSDTRSWCAYKGHARYWSAQVNGELRRNLAWSYEEPLSDGVEVKNRITFFDERVDVTVDGKPRPRPVTPWS